MDSEIIKMVSWPIVVLILAVIVFFVFRPNIARVIDRIRHVDKKSISFYSPNLEKAVKPQLERIIAKVSCGDYKQLKRRVSHTLDLFKGTKILWISSDPKRSQYEKDALTKDFGANLEVVKSTDEAAKKAIEYNLVVSEVLNDDVTKIFQSKWTIAYVVDDVWGKEKPPYIFGYTNRVDALFHYIIDILERDKI